MKHGFQNMQTLKFNSSMHSFYGINRSTCMFCGMYGEQTSIETWLLCSFLSITCFNGSAAQKAYQHSMCR